MSNIHKLILYFVSFFVVVSISFYFVNQNIKNIGSYEGEESEKSRIKQEFLNELHSKESLTEAFINNISIGYDHKVSDYFVKVSYKDEPNVVYFYSKKENLGSFYLSDIMVDEQIVTDYGARNKLINKHRFEPEI
ncbi:hypothetical protein J2T17_007823 [Paenibacillus mucilaginosus]